MPPGNSRRARASRRRSRRVAAADNDLTAQEWAELCAMWGGCAYCGQAEASLASTLQKDCVQPISRGGRYTLSNVVPACRSCNASKSNDEVTGWMRRKKLDEPAFLLRFREVVVALTAAQAASAADASVQAASAASPARRTAPLEPAPRDADSAPRGKSA